MSLSKSVLLLVLLLPRKVDYLATIVPLLYKVVGVALVILDDEVLALGLGFGFLELLRGS